MFILTANLIAGAVVLLAVVLAVSLTFVFWKD